MALPKQPKRSPAEGELPFEYDWTPAEEVLTAYAGIPLFVRAARLFGVPASVKQHLHVKERQRGLDEATYVESFLVLNALGGECLDDFGRLRDERRADGPQGVITFAISVRMTPNLKKHIARLQEQQWKPYREDAEAVSECADLLDYWPEEEDRPEGAGPLRYVAIRVRRRRSELFADGAEARYFVVASNRWDWAVRKLLVWHREKAGTIEALHDVLNNELAAGVLPCGRFGANAAWLRLALLTHNVLTGLKRIGLKPEYPRARPKRLRFRIFCSPGKLVHHARQLVARVGRQAAELLEWAGAWVLLAAPA